MTLGQKLKKLRIKKGLTQKELAEQVHVTFQTVSKWENDENEPDFSTLKELTKIYGCSYEYLFNDEEDKEPVKEEEEPEPEEEEEEATKTIIIHQKELHVCERCKKDIPEDELEMEQIMVAPGGRGYSATYRQGYYHKSCLAKLKAERFAAEEKVRKYKSSKSKKICFGWAIAAGVSALGIGLGLLLGAGHGSIHPAAAVIWSFVFSYAMFAMIYCILSGSYIGSVFASISSWSIKFPGLLFTWDLEGFAWLIAMKLLFAVLGFFIAIITELLAIFIAGALAIPSFPFVLIYNIKNDYENAFF